MRRQVAAVLGLFAVENWCLPVVETFSFFVPEAADQDHDEVDEGPNSESTESADHEDAGTDFTDVEAMNPESTEEPAQDRGRQSTLCRDRFA